MYKNVQILSQIYTLHNYIQFYLFIIFSVSCNFNDKRTDEQFLHEKRGREFFRICQYVGNSWIELGANH